MVEEAKIVEEKTKLRLDIAEFQKFQMKGQEEERMRAEKENEEEGKKVRLKEDIQFISGR